MKKLVLFLTTAALLSSCTAVKFEEPQPSAASSISEFPARMQGLYVSNNDDTLRIESFSFRYSSGPEVNIEAKLSSSNAVLKKVKNKYILSLKDEDGWDVFPIKISRNRLITHYANLDAETEQLIFKLKESSPVEEVRTEEGKFDHYLIKPTDKEFRKLLRKKLFSQQMIFRRIN